jgi:hypothetical protein
MKKLPNNFSEITKIHFDYLICGTLLAQVIALSSKKAV